MGPYRPLIDLFLINPSKRLSTFQNPHLYGCPVSQFLIDLYLPLSTLAYRPLSLIDPLSTFINLYRPLSTFIDLYRPLSTFIDLYRPLLIDPLINPLSTPEQPMNNRLSAYRPLSTLVLQPMKFSSVVMGFCNHACQR